MTPSFLSVSLMLSFTPLILAGSIPLIASANSCVVLTPTDREKVRQDVCQQVATGVLFDFCSVVVIA